MGEIKKSREALFLGCIVKLWQEALRSFHLYFFRRYARQAAQPTFACGGSIISRASFVCVWVEVPETVSRHAVRRVIHKRLRRGSLLCAATRSGMISQEAPQSFLQKHSPVRFPTRETKKTGPRPIFFVFLTRGGIEPPLLP